MLFYSCNPRCRGSTQVSWSYDEFLALSNISYSQLNADMFILGDRSLSSGFLRSTASIHAVEDLSGDDAAAFHAWFKALFDSSSEGIEDTILR